MVRVELLQDEGMIEHRTLILEAVNRESFGSRRAKRRAEPLEGVRDLGRERVRRSRWPNRRTYSPISRRCSSDTQAYFSEEIEDGVSVYYFDGYGATVEQVSLTQIDEA
jgi:hypothetical protein